MSLYNVDRERCIRCGICVRLCPSKIIEADGEKHPFVAAEKEKRCIRCGQCVAFCPSSCNSLSFPSDSSLQSEEVRPAVDASLFPSAESAETLLRSRRSIRDFKKEGVPHDILKRLFETVRYAPTASNRQAVRWIVLETREKTEDLERRIIDFFRTSLAQLSSDLAQPPSDDGKTAMLRFILGRWDAGDRIIFRGAPQLAVAVVSAKEGMQEDGAIALTYLELAAHALGVGCCWGGFFTHAFRSSPDLRAFLGIAKGEHVAGAQMIGYPVLGLSKRLPPRKPLNLTWF